MITIAKVISVASDFVKVLRFGNEDVNTPETALPYGIDSKPIKNKRGIVFGTKKKGRNIITGYLLKSDKTQSGEIRVYSTDDTGTEKFYIQLFKDGTCEIGGKVDNMVRYSELEIAFNQLKSDFNTFITAYNLHTHAGVTVGTGITGITVSGSPSAADISGAKIDEIKTI